MASKTYISVDLGAGSGRVIAVTSDDSTLSLDELHRFDNTGIDVPGGSFWNLAGLYREILEGLRRAVTAHGNSLGIETWRGRLRTDRPGRWLPLPKSPLPSSPSSIPTIRHLPPPERRPQKSPPGANNPASPSRVAKAASCALPPSRWP